MQLQHTSGLKYMGFVLDDSGTDGGEYCKKRMSKSRVIGAVEH